MGHPWTQKRMPKTVTDSQWQMASGVNIRELAQWPLREKEDQTAWKLDGQETLPLVFS